ncbi:T9SS type A sorting domain-containing protein [Flavobacterium sp. MAH-1]|uniref:T9SS type A sorting domain-containing protein n=1 Tax=Flavobacterium agri TaxID=2743471 RepID=A0A7Y8Y143_9FLAO|nr:T9SS type A sorting domain-containing protein [Flavobacterium agri]NUY80650.1 T9SS type A sorting domain-containing protein [Flavobacterium agri]NYA70674.1 T9SS type A sorting domain-containing protein [Flavobacterium agri]
MKTPLFFLLFFLSVFGIHAQECETPTALQISNITTESASFAWTANGSETQWEILVLYAGGPFPLPTMEGVIVSNNPATLTGLECPESFDVYVRAVCATSNSDWSMPVTFSTTGCPGSVGDPQDLYACAQDGTACFDLSANDELVLGSSEAWEVEITYHTSQADAENGDNPILDTTQYCIAESVGTQTLYVAVNDFFAGTQNIYTFDIIVSTVNTSDLPLSPITQCDQEGTGTIVFDLTVAASQLGSGTLTYYTTLQNAIGEQNAIAQPAAYAVSSASGSSTIYIREDYGVGCDFVYTMQINALANCDNPAFCIGANSLCDALGVPFANTTGVDQAESGNDYGCMDTTYDPTWFYFSTSGAGNIELLIEQSTDINFSEANLDIDFICYGPFANPSDACTQLTTDKIVDCSYSASLSEVVSIPNTQPGQYYLIMASNYDGVPGYIRVSETNNSQGEINCTGLRLNAFLDANGNGTKEASEANFNLGQFHYEKNGNGIVHNITSPTGIHRIYDTNTSNAYDLNYTVNSEYASYYNLTTNSYADVSAVEGAGLQDYPFPVTIAQVYNDVAVTIVPNEEPRPGFTYDNTIRYTNSGNQPVASGTLTFTHDAAVSIVSVSQSGIVNTPNGFTYVFTNLQPFETREITVTMQIPTIPTVNLDDLLTNTVSIAGVSGEVTTENNTSTSAQIVIGSYDPNDKMEARGPQILHSSFTSDDYLYYTIRFENTGTASAINIHVDDTLDAQLDAETLRMVSASHNYTLDRVGSQLRWRFENILLQPSVEGSSVGHGYITFKVKPNPGYAVGDVISNTAHIYFDFNPAIVTNTFTSTFVSQLQVDEFKQQTLVVYPNPVDDYVTFSFNDNSDIETIIIYDVTGKRLLQTSNNTIDLSSAAPGLYFADVLTRDKIKFTRKLVVK